MFAKRPRHHDHCAATTNAHHAGGATSDLKSASPPKDATVPVFAARTVVLGNTALVSLVVDYLNDRHRARAAGASPTFSSATTQANRRVASVVLAESALDVGAIARVFKTYPCLRELSLEHMRGLTSGAPEDMARIAKLLIRRAPSSLRCVVLAAPDVTIEFTQLVCALGIQLQRTPRPDLKIALRWLLLDAFDARHLTMPTFDGNRLLQHLRSADVRCHHAGVLEKLVRGADACEWLRLHVESSSRELDAVTRALTLRRTRGLSVPDLHIVLAPGLATPVHALETAAPFTKSLCLTWVPPTPSAAILGRCEPPLASLAPTLQTLVFVGTDAERVLECLRGSPRHRHNHGRRLDRDEQQQQTPPPSPTTVFRALETLDLRQLTLGGGGVFAFHPDGDSEEDEGGDNDHDEGADAASVAAAAAISPGSRRKAVFARLIRGVLAVAPSLRNLSLMFANPQLRIDDLASLSSLTKVVELSLTMPPEFAQSAPFGVFRSMTNLKRLHLTQATLFGADVAAWPTGLEQLVLHECNVPAGGSGGSARQTWARLTRLSVLRLRNVDVRVLQELALLPRVKALVFHGDMSRLLFSAFAKFLGVIGGGLERLELPEAHLNGNALATVGACISPARLRHFVVRVLWDGADRPPLPRWMQDLDRLQVGSTGGGGKGRRASPPIVSASLSTSVVCAASASGGRGLDEPAEAVVA